MVYEWTKKNREDIKTKLDEAMAKEDQQGFLELVGSMANEMDRQLEVNAPAKPAGRKASDLTVDELQDLFNKPSYGGRPSLGGGPASGTETTPKDDLKRDPETNRPIVTFRVPKIVPTGNKLSQYEIKVMRDRSDAARRDRSRMETREQARRMLAAYRSHEEAGGTLSDHHAERKREYERILNSGQ